MNAPVKLKSSKPNALTANAKFKRLTDPECGFRTAVQEANQILAYAAIDLSRCSVTFDSRLAKKDITTSVNATVCSRIVKKFHILNKNGQQALRSAAISGFLRYEKHLRTTMLYYSISDNPLLFSVRRQLLSLFRDFTVDYTDEDIDVGPGETFNPSQGYTHLIAKLNELSHWTTTPECLEDTYLLVYHNRTLKRMAKVHMGHISRSTRRKLHAQYKDHPNPGFAVFCELLDGILTVVPGSRLSSVPKNNETDRVINIEPLFPMILQRYVAKAIKRCLAKAGYGLDFIVQGSKKESLANQMVDRFIGSVVGPVPEIVDKLRDRQEIHKRMIADPKYATIDFSNASDSVLTTVVQSLFPVKVASYLLQFRSRVVCLDDQELELFKLSSMGNGFTFETMTSLLLACCRVFTDDCSVFGDDVIIPNTYAKEFVKLCSNIGFVVNNKKTFINSPFRESCGAFYRDGYGYITSFDVTQCEVFADVITNHNKIHTLIDVNRDVLTPDVLRVLEDTREMLSGLIPASRKGPVPERLESKYENLSNYAFDVNSQKKHRKNDSLRGSWQRWVDDCKEVFECYCWDPRDFLLVNVCSFTPSRMLAKDKRRHRIALDAARLRAMRPVVETVRGKGRWKQPLAFVNIHSGDAYLVKRLILERNKMRKHQRTHLLKDKSGHV